MKNQNKEIEEMSEVIASKICEEYSPKCEEWQPHNCGQCYANNTHISEVAEALYNAGYRKQSDNVIELPCKVGDKIYYISAAKKVIESKIHYGGGYARGIAYSVDGKPIMECIFLDADINSNAYLTREEAEQALAKMKGGE